jgi:hypothetical protein
MSRRALLLLLFLATAVPASAQSSAPAPTPPAEVELEAPPLSADVQLRAYAIFPKFRFRDGTAERWGSSIRTQKIGLDEWRGGGGGQASLWIGDADRLTLDVWTMKAQGSGPTAIPLTFNGEEIAADTWLATQYTFNYAALEYVHRLQPVDWLWVDVGARLEYLDFRVTVSGVDRTALEAAWPTVRVHVGVRPVEWLEVEGRFGGFELTVPLGSTHVEQPYEVGGLVRVRLPVHGMYVEVGGLMYHVHLEEAPGEPEEDALHLRHRALFVAFGLSF